MGHLRVQQTLAGDMHASRACGPSARRGEFTFFFPNTTRRMVGRRYYVAVWLEAFVSAVSGDVFASEGEWYAAALPSLRLPRFRQHLLMFSRAKSGDF